jgi:hypothetical protein
LTLLDAVDRPSRTSQQSRMKIRYSRRRDTADHHVPRLVLGALPQLTGEADFWRSWGIHVVVLPSRNGFRIAVISGGRPALIAFLLAALIPGGAHQP